MKTKADFGVSLRRMRRGTLYLNTRRFRTRVLCKGVEQIGLSVGSALGLPAYDIFGAIGG